MARKKKSDTELQFGIKFDNRELARGVRESLRILSTFSKGIAREFAKLGSIALPKGLGEFNYGGDYRKKTATPTEEDIAAKKELLKDPTQDLTEKLQKDRLEDWKKDWETQFKMEQAVTSKMFKDLGKKTVGEERKVASWQYAEEVRAGDREKFGSDYAKKIPLMAKREDIVTRIYDKTTQTTKELVRTILAQQKLTSLGLKWEIVSDTTKENLVSSSEAIGKIAKDMSQTTDMASILRAQLDLVNRQLEKGGLTEEKTLALGKRRLQLQRQIDALTVPEEPKEETTKTSTRLRDMASNMTTTADMASVLRAQLEFVTGQLKEGELTESQTIALGKQRLALLAKIDKIENPKGPKKKGFFRTILDRFKSVSVYRAIRTVLKELVNSLIDTISGIASVSKEFKGSMSNMTSQLTKLWSLGGVVLYQVLMMFEPVIESITNGLVQMVNKLSLAMAVMRGGGEVVRINTEYWEEYKDAMSGVLFSFDTFNTLSSQTGPDYSKLFDVSNLDDVSDKEKDDVKDLANILGLIKETIASIISLVAALMPIIEPIINAVLEAVNIFVPNIMKFLDWIMPVLKPVFDIVTFSLKAIFQLISAIISLVTLDFKGAAEMLGETFKSTFNSVIKLFEVAVNACIAGLNTLLSPINLMGQMFGADRNFAQIQPVSFKTFATGGQFKSGDFFVANENGSTEMIASSNNGGGNVMNLDQWQSVSTMGFYNALVMYGAAKDEDGNFDIDRLATTIARNRAFKSELNRTNPRLGLV